MRRSLPISGESICPYCGVGCRLTVAGSVADGLRIRGTADAPANLGRLCAKGALLGDSVATSDRLTRPLISAQRNGTFQPASWDVALQHVVDRFKKIRQRYGPDSIAFYGSGQLDSETSYLACKLFKGHLGTNNTDSNSRLCMAASVAGYRSSLGSDGPPTCYEDVELADVVLITGSNTAEAHPVLFDRLRAAKQARPEMTIIVIDPRRTQTARAADLYVPVQPGGDVALFNALGRLLMERGAVDAAFVQRHTNGFDEYHAFLLHQPLDALCAAAGVERSLLETVAAHIAGADKFLSLYCMGLNQSTAGTWKNNSLINLHLLTGQIGKPGAGPFSLTGQPNAMGGREAGLLAHQLPGYRFVEDAAHRRDTEAHWNLPPGTIQPRMGLTVVEMFRALESGKLKAIWIAATNPAVSLPDLHQVQRALRRAELVVVSDAFHPTETTRFADVLLPAASWGEKEWTSTSSERLVSLSPKLFDAPGEALPDWEILARFARRWGLPGFDYADRAAVWDEFRQLTAGRPCDMNGISSIRLREQRHVYWPCPSADHPGTQRRYLDRVFPTPDGRARFLPRPHHGPREGIDHEFPFILTTGRVYGHWHTLTRTAKCDKLVKREPEPYVEIHPDDASQLGASDGDLLQISSRRGTIRLAAHLTETVAPGTIFMPFHWGDLYAPDNAVNYLTIGALDAVSKQPELKFCAVAVEKVAAAVTEPMNVPVLESARVPAVCG